MHHPPPGSSTPTRFIRTKLSAIIHLVGSQLTNRIRSFGGYNIHQVRQLIAKRNIEATLWSRCLVSLGAASAARGR